MALVLIVDDELMVREPLQRVLEGAGYQAHTAADLDEATVKLDATEYDVVVIDILLPKRSGMELLRQLRESSPAVKAIIITGHPTAETAAEAVRLGAFDYLIKPIMSEDLCRSVANAVQMKNLEAENQRYKQLLEEKVDLQALALRQSEARLATILDTVPDGICEVTLDGRIVYANEAARSLFGAKADCTKTMMIQDFLPEISLQRAQEVMREVVHNKKALRGFSFMLHRRDGVVVPMEANAVYVEREGQEPTILGSAQDVSGRVNTLRALQESEEKFRRIVESSPVAIAMLQMDADDRLLVAEANFQVGKIIGSDHRECLGREFTEVFPFLQGTEIPAQFRAIAAGGGNWQTEYVRHEEEDIAVAYDVHAVQTSPGNLVVLAMDITERKRSEDLKRKSEEQLQAVFGLVQTGIMIFDPETSQVADVNDAACAMIGLPREHIIGQTFNTYIHALELPGDFIEAARDGLLIDEEMTLRTHEGEQLSIFISIVPLELSGREMLLASIVDYTLQKQAEEVLRKQATRDALTDLYNRRFIMDRLEIEFKAAQRYGTPFSMCLCDLDRFKQVNDTHGHQTGDAILVEFAELLKNELRIENLAGRYGGDEFLILFPHSRARDALHSLERIRQKLAGLTFTSEGGDTFSLTATFGIADFSSDQENPNQLFAVADMALYQAKEQGRNTIVVREDNPGLN